MKFLRNILPLGFLFLSISCLETPVVDERKAVIDGWIDSDGFPVVLFTSSVVPGESKIPIEENLIRWGVVKISDGDKTIIMTGGPTNDYFPPYRYVTYEMKGEPGKTYTVTADYKDLHAEATCRMLPPTEITGISISPMEDNDTLRTAELSFITPPDVPAYYYITMRNMGETGRFLPTMLGAYKALEPNVEVKLPVLHPKNQLSEEDYVSQLRIGDKLEIHLCRITEEVYNFWQEYDNAILFGGTQFFSSTQSLQGNVRGGYGVWSAQGVSTALLEVK